MTHHADTITADNTLDAACKEAVRLIRAGIDPTPTPGAAEVTVRPLLMERAG